MSTIIDQLTGLTSVSSRGLPLSVVSGSRPVLPRTLPGRQRRHVHALQGGGALATGRRRPIMHLLTVPVAVVTYRQEDNCHNKSLWTNSSIICVCEVFCCSLLSLLAFQNKSVCSAQVEQNPVLVPLTSSSGWTSSSRWPPSASAVPASTYLLRAVEALILSPVLIRVTSSSGPAGASSSEPERSSRSSSLLFGPL